MSLKSRCAACALSLFLLISTRGAGLTHFELYRVFGTNVYDFTPVAQALRLGNPVASTYLLSGRVISASEGVAQIEQHVGMRCVFTGSEAIPMADTKRLLELMAADRMVRDSGGNISLGNWFALSPSIRRWISREPITRLATLTNAPKGLAPGHAVTLFAAPMRITTGAALYDFGHPFRGNIQLETNRYFVLADRVQRTAAPVHSTKAASTNAQEVLRWRRERASAGSPVAQYELGKRLITGEEFEQNLEEGEMWLRKASSNGSREAARLLKERGLAEEPQSKD